MGVAGSKAQQRRQAQRERRSTARAVEEAAAAAASLEDWVGALPDDVRALGSPELLVADDPRKGRWGLSEEELAEMREEEEAQQRALHVLQASLRGRVQHFVEQQEALATVERFNETWELQDLRRATLADLRAKGVASAEAAALLIREFALDLSELELPVAPALHVELPISNISFAGCTELQSVDSLGKQFPASLDLTCCAALTNIGALRQVEGDLLLRGSSVRKLPDGLNVGGDLDLRDCRELERLPDDLRVGGNLLLSGSVLDVTELPKGLSVHGDLDLKETPLQSLPQDLVVGGVLTLDSCTELSISSIHELLGRVESLGGLNLVRCNQIESLGVDRLHIKGDLDLAGCSNLRKLPEALVVEGDLTLRNCESLSSWPEEEFVVGGDLVMDRLTCAASPLPESLEAVGGNLRLAQWKGVDHGLPDSLASVGGDLVLNGQAGLRQLPAKLSIGGALRVKGCIALKELPERISVGGGVFLEGSGVKTLPTGFHLHMDVSMTRPGERRAGVMGLWVLGPDNVVHGAVTILCSREVPDLPQALTVEGILEIDGIWSEGRVFDFACHPGLRVNGGIKASCRVDNLPQAVFGSVEVVEAQLAVGCHVHGDLRFRNWDPLDIPDGLRVDGTMIVTTTMRGGGEHAEKLLDRLPADLTVLGSLSLSGQLPLTALFDDIRSKRLDGDLLVKSEGQEPFTLAFGVQECLDIGGKLSLYDYGHLLESMPAKVVVGGKTTLEEIAIPLDDVVFELNGSVHLGYLSAVETFAFPVHVRGDLFVGHCEKLHNLSANLTTVDGDVELVSLPSLVELPKNLRVTTSGRVTISACPQLLEIGEWDLPNVQTLSISDCPKLERRDFRVLRRLCPKLLHLTLEDLPGLDVIGELPSSLEQISVLRCENLRRLPESLGELKWLDLIGCKSLEKLPDRLVVRQRLVASGCSKLRVPPSRVMEAESAVIDGTNLSAADVIEMQLTLAGTKRVQLGETPEWHRRLESPAETLSIQRPDLDKNWTKTKSLCEALQVFAIAVGVQGAGFGNIPDKARQNLLMDWLLSLRVFQAPALRNSVTWTSMMFWVRATISALTCATNDYQGPPLLCLWACLDKGKDQDPFHTLQHLRTAFLCEPANREPHGRQQPDTVPIRERGKRLLTLTTLSEMVQKLDFAIAPELLPAVRWHAVVYAGRDIVSAKKEKAEVLPTFAKDLFEQAGLEERAQAVITEVTDEALDSWLPTWPSWLIDVRRKAAATLQPEEDFALWEKPLSRKELASLRGVKGTHAVKMISTDVLMPWNSAVDEWVRTGEIMGRTIADVEQLKAEVFLVSRER
ncbi:Disease resistance-like protein CSA1 (Protein CONSTITUTIVE SHADE-AVOIDANCE 1) [Durusdinium trenchii]|uniref:Disease resistance-like protein CSA1 (Protein CONSTITUTIVE SHADE-AVOIDANCE 1) n=1 Tax=Durusdinium trenchii TaxID=1381693 RepID=A0ABP0Q235_9DINO